MATGAQFNMDLNLIFSQLKTMNGTWWFGHQSDKECVYGSDGVGHGFVHPADKLEAACRNCWTALHASYGMKDKIDERQLDIEGCEERLEGYKEDFKTDEIEKGYIITPADKRVLKKLEIELLRHKREQECDLLMYEEKLKTVDVYFKHIENLLPIVAKDYDSHDDALEDAWMARVAYEAQVKNHPLGHDLKISILPEEKKHELIKMMGFPTSFKNQLGQDVPMPTPDARAILNALEDFKKIQRSELNGAKGLIT